MTVHTPAIVLKSFPYGETSIISKCFTKEKGKVSFIVRGARSKKSSKFSHFQPLSYIDIIYNPLPNHLHIKTTLKASKYGKIYKVAGPCK